MRKPHNPDWQAAPLFVNFITTDEDGTAKGHENEPTLTDGVWKSIGLNVTLGKHETHLMGSVSEWIVNRPRMYDDIDWEKYDRRYKYAATDRHGFTNLYVSEPKVDREFWTGDGEAWIGVSHTGGKRWQETLVKRP